MCLISAQMTTTLIYFKNAKKMHKKDEYYLRQQRE